jgi:hypothetical protein
VIGSDLLKGQEAFKKVREFHKGTNIDLFSNSNNQEVVKQRLNQHFFNNSFFLSSTNFGLIRQKNLFSGAVNDTYLIDTFPSSQIIESRADERKFFPNFLRILMLTKNYSLETQNTILPKSFFYPKIFTSVTETDSEVTKPTLVLPIVSDERNVLQNKNLINSSFLGSRSLKFFTKILTKSTNQSSKNLVIDSEKILLNEQSPRYYTKLNFLKSNMNLSGSDSLLNSNNEVNKKNFVTSSPTTINVVNNSQQMDVVLTYKLLTNSFFDLSSTSSILSSKPELNSYDYAPVTTKVFLSELLENSKSAPNTLTYQKNVWEQRGSVTNLLTGSRERAPQVLNQTYWSLF